MDHRITLEKKKQTIMRVLKGGQQLGIGTVVRSELVGEIQKARQQSTELAPEKTEVTQTDSTLQAS